MALCKYFLNLAFAAFAVGPPSALLERTCNCNMTWCLGPSVDWRTLTWTQTPTFPVIAVNALEDKYKTHLPSYMTYTPYCGEVLIKRGLLIDFMGFVIMKELYCNWDYMSQPNYHAIRVRQCHIYEQMSAVLQDHEALMKASGMSPALPIFQTQWPVVAEEYFEYDDVLGAVSDYIKSKSDSKRKFVFVELGAGYGHWTFTAHKALMQKVPQASYKYLMVDCVDELLPVIRQLAVLNEVSMTDGQDSALHVHVGFVGTSGNATIDRLWEKEQHTFYVGAWGLNAAKKYSAARPISLASLLDIYKMPCELDLVDVDIQGVEYRLFESAATIDMLTARAHRLHIGLHGTKAQSRVLQQLFNERGWTTRWYFGEKTWEWKSASTPLGPVAFGDGVLSLINPNPNLCQGLQ